MRAAARFRVRRQRCLLYARVAACVALAAGADAAALAAGASATAAQSGEPIRIPMEPFGYEPLGHDYLLNGATGLTVDFVDNNLLLVTFNTRELMKREADARPDDDDRMVEALLVELPTVKVLARTEWRLHDRLQYLWNLGHGRFLLRVRDRLTLLAPADRLAMGDAFRGTPVLDLSTNGVDRQIVALDVSSDQDLLTLETVERRAASSKVTFSGTGNDAGVQINFYRMDFVAEGFVARPAGIVHAPEALELPMTRAGVIDVLSGGKNRWLFNFDEHAGKVDELAEWDIPCQPHPVVVSHSEFVAFGCRGNGDTAILGAFNLNGEEMWEQGLYEPYVSPRFAYAPAAGRFALERTIVTGPVDSLGFSATLVQGEEVRVYQTETGKVLLKVETSPVEPAGGNFALSPDGMKLATFDQAGLARRTSKLGDPYTETATTLLVYPLPPLSDKERAQVKEMEAKAPADAGARIDASLARISQEDAAGITSAPQPAVAANQPQAVATGEMTSADPNVASGVKMVGGSADETVGDTEPGNPAMTGQLPNAPGMAAASSAGAGDEEQPVRRGAPTLYQPGEEAKERKTSSKE